MIGTQRVCEVYRLGVMPYDDAWQLQARLAGEVAAGERTPALLLLEHPHTYTFGRSGHSGNLLWSEPELRERGITVVWADRGGDVTYHGPGQLVGYPILPLGRLSGGDGYPGVVDYVGYVRRVEETLILALSKFGIVAGQIRGLTGVWVQPDVASRCLHCDPALKQAPSKIASIGVKVDVNGVTRHGFALNVNPDPEFWGGIIPCGLQGVCMSSLADFFEEPPRMESVIDAVCSSFSHVFDYKLVECTNII